MLARVEAEIRDKYGISLRKVTARHYAVFRDGKPIGSVCLLYPDGWYFTNEDIKLPYCGTTRIEAIYSFLQKGGDPDVL